ncbi:MAG: PfkB domain protein [Pseudonocardiales bacterium]|nr:PfkB domain protein [Pseudonocardiales bacterium]
MVDVLAQLPGELAVGSDRPAPIRLLGGGSAANTASWIAASKAAVTLVGRVGDDAFGRQTSTELEATGVELALAVDADRSTGCCIVLVSPSGERTMIPDAGANSALAPADLRDGLFAGDRHLHLSGYTLFGPSRAAGLHALATARAAGMSISVDAASSAPIATVGAETFLDWLGDDILLLANADEAMTLTGHDDPRHAADRLAQRVKAVAVKLGAQGAIWAGGSPMIEVAPSAIIEVVDTTGAGDAFAAGLLLALARGDQPGEALAAGNALAARACVVAGGRSRTVS